MAPRTQFPPCVRHRRSAILEALGNIGDFIGGIGVVVTLLYLVMQIRQNTRQIDHNSELVRGSAELDTARLMADWHGTVADSPELVRIWGAHMAGGAEALTAEDRARLVWLIAQYFTIVEGLYHQHLRGFLSLDSWIPYERTLSGLLRKALPAQFISSPTSAFSGDFRRLCMRLIESPRDDDWQYSDLADFGMHRDSA
jgi:hypothetical protein